MCVSSHSFSQVRMVGSRASTAAGRELVQMGLSLVSSSSVVSRAGEAGEVGVSLRGRNLPSSLRKISLVDISSRTQYARRPQALISLEDGGLDWYGEQR